MTVGINVELLKAYREKEWLSQEEFAERGSQPSLATIKRIEAASSGVYSARPQTARALASKLGVNVDELTKRI